MNYFTASNGTHVRRVGRDTFQFSPRETAPQMTLGAAYMVAARELFQAEADERLGRWRWPEHPDYVVYHWDQPQSAGVVVVSEAEAVPSRVLHVGADPENPTPEYRAARAYFDAHPEPKPWHDAKPGEVWELTLAGEEPAAFYPSKSLDRRFTPVMPNTGSTAVQFDWPEIIAGRRIWPEVGS